MKKQLALLIVLLLVPLSTSAQDFCEGNFDYDQDVDGSDAFTFKMDFGRSLLKNPCPPDGPAPVPKTGQFASYYLLDDGELQKGVEWPFPRFTDNFDGTITDNLTGLIWLKNANCFGERTWGLALTDVWALSSGDCGLQDGSGVFDWRLPNRFELESLLDLGYIVPCLSDTEGIGKWTEGDPFNNVMTGNYWSSTTLSTSPDYAWFVSFHFGSVHQDLKSTSAYVWPVRSGH
jgi:hypothetical protein